METETYKKKKEFEKWRMKSKKNNKNNKNKWQQQATKYCHVMV